MKPNYNLLDEAWIPVRRTSGAQGWVAPWQLTDPNDPIVSIESPRPDFDGALVQFMIGLLQTMMPPKTKEEWEKHFKEPPTGAVLKARLANVRDSFWLDGDGPRFLQEQALSSDPKNAGPVEALLIDAAGANTIKHNKDFFVQRDRVPAMSLPIAAMALLTLQTNAPSGGAGHRTSLRGGGPLTTLLLGRTLWETLWLNVLLDEDFAKVPGNRTLNLPAATFPWMAATRTSEQKTGQATGSKDIHPAQHFWGMPRRIRLLFSGPGRCVLSGTEAERTVTSYVTSPSGVNYVSEELRHPLTAHSRLKAGKPWLARKGQPTGLAYRDWPALMLSYEENSEPARCIAAAHAHRWMKLLPAEHQRVWVFGYDMDNMKARCWYSGTTPLLTAPTAEDRQELARCAARLVDASEYARKELIKQTKTALFRRPQDAKGDLSFLSRKLWSATEPDFYQILHVIRVGLIEDEVAPTEALEAWLESLRSAVTAIFEECSQQSGDFSAADVRRIAVASNTLRRKIHPNSRGFRKLLQLPPLKR